MPARRVILFAAWFLLSAVFSANSSSAAPPVQYAGCPTVLPAEEGERSIVVPSVDPAVIPPHVASRPTDPAHEAARSLLINKLAERDRLQQEIAALRETTNTPGQILVRVKMLEVNLTKLRQAKLDLSANVDGQPKSVPIAALLDSRSTNPAAAAPTHNYANYASIDNSFLGIFPALEQHNLGKVIAIPQVVVIDGRAASINVGGQVPIPGPSDSSNDHIDYGTRLDVTATCLGDNRVRLAVRPRITELDNSNGIVINGKQVPATRVREINFGCEVEFGKSALMSGLVQERTVATKSIWPLRNNVETHEIALVVVVTPEIVR